MSDVNDEAATSLCWCFQPHPDHPEDFAEAWRGLWHLAAQRAHLPEALTWLSGLLEHRR